MAKSSFYERSTNYDALTENDYRTAVIELVVDGGGSAVVPGDKADLHIPFDCTITQWTLFADAVGSALVDVKKVAYAAYPPTGSDSITGGNSPRLNTAIKAQDSTLAGWTTSITANDILRFTVTSAAVVTRLTLSLTVLKSIS